MDLGKPGLWQMTRADSAPRLHSEPSLRRWFGTQKFQTDTIADTRLDIR